MVFVDLQLSTQKDFLPLNQPYLNGRSASRGRGAPEKLARISIRVHCICRVFARYLGAAWRRANARKTAVLFDDSLDDLDWHPPVYSLGGVVGFLGVRHQFFDAR